MARRLAAGGAVERVIRVSVVVNSEMVRFRAELRAESIEEAVRLAALSYPGGEVRVLFPIDPDTFFVEESAPAPGGASTGEGGQASPRRTFQVRGTDRRLKSALEPTT